MKKNVYEGKSLLFKGPYSLSFDEGEYEILGYKPAKNEKIVIPENKVVAVNIKKTGKLGVREDYPKDVKEVQGGTIPVSWEKLYEKIIKENINSILLIGACDTGKTTLTNYLTNKLVARNKRVGIIDSDLGQSDIGPVGTIGLGVMEKNVFNLSDHKPFRYHFIGSTSPSMNIVETLVGIKKLNALALMNSDFLLVDSSGWVNGDGGRLLKQAKIEMINPDLIVLIQQKSECEHLIKGINGYRIFRTATSNYVKKKSFEDRKEFRKQNILSYLESAKTLKLPLRKLRLKRCFLMSGKKQQIPEEFSTMILSVEKLEENEGYLIVLKKELNYDKLKAVKEFYGNKVRLIIAGEEKNIYVGLADETNKFIGVGFVEKIDYVKENIFIYSNIDAQLIKTVSFGILKINEKGEEIGFVKPGKF